MTSTGLNKIKLGDISITLVKRLLDSLEVISGHRQALMERYGLAASILQDPNARISISKFMRMGQDAIQYSQRADIGLICSKHSTLSDLGLTGHLSMVCQDLASAMRVWCKYERLSSQNCRGQSSFTLNDSQGILRFYSISPYSDYNRFVVDMVLSCWWQWLQWLATKPIALDAVHLEYPEPPYANALGSLFNCKVLYEQEHNALIIPAKAANTACKYANALMFKTLITHCNRELKQLSKTRSYTEQVQEALGPMLEGSNPTLEAVAAKIKLPTWTLRRKLTQENNRFQDILDNTRHSLAKSYMRDTNYTLGEISYLLGFSSPTAFQRAFKRWSLVAPGEFRRSVKLNGH